MAKKSRNYWRKRFESLEEAQLNKGVEYYDSLEREYKKASHIIQTEINAWYGRFALNNNISLGEAKQLLSTKELEEFKWDVNEYIKYGKENAVNEMWMKELDNASARVHISRLEALKIQIQNQVEVLYSNQTDGIDKLARNIYTDGYYHTAFEVQRGFNIGYTFPSLNANQLNRVISRPWTPDGSNFKDKCWTAKRDLVNTLHTQLTQAIIRGDSPDKAIKAIAKQFDVSKNRAGRLVMTESAFFASAAQMDCYKELDVEKYEIVATLDNHTSALCQDLDGKVFDMKDYQVGITAPPFHPWCRTCTVPYFDDNFGERAARGADGKTYYVPSDMKYKDWKKKYVIKEEDGIIKNNKLADVVNKVKALNLQDYANRSDLGKDILKALDLEYIPVDVRPISAHGFCAIENSDIVNIKEYVLNSKDQRENNYKIKTALHEAFHAKANGMEFDYHKIKQNWIQIEETLTESAAHYLAKAVGIMEEISPAYAEKLVEMLPRLKQLDRFKLCSTIADFGEVAWIDRLNGVAPVWRDLFRESMETKHDWKQYSKQYFSYIRDKEDELVSKMLENMPQYTSYKEDMINDCKGAMKSIENGTSMNQNQQTVFQNVLIITMNRVGVK